MSRHGAYVATLHGRVARQQSALSERQSTHDAHAARASEGPERETERDHEHNTRNLHATGAVELSSGTLHYVVHCLSYYSVALFTTLFINTIHGLLKK